MDLDASVVINISQLAKVAYKEVDASAGATDHTRQGFL